MKICLVCPAPSNQITNQCPWTRFMRIKLPTVKVLLWVIFHKLGVWARFGFSALFLWDALNV